jgi:hypothetical protein
MSSSDAQPPLTRRQARERERAGETGALPVVPPPSVEEPAEQTRRRPGSHAAPLRPAPVAPPTAPRPSEAAQPPVAEAAPASATEIVPGTGMTRRQLRAFRAAQDEAVRPVPLQAPTPQSSDRTVAEVLDTVAVVEGQQHPDPAAGQTEHEAAARAAAERAEAERIALEQATVADSAPAAVEPLREAAEHGEEPPRRRSTWAPYVPGAEAEPAPEAAPVMPPAATSAPTAPASERSSEVAEAVDAPQAEPESQSFRLPLPSEVPSPREPGVFPLDLDADTNDVPVLPAPAAASTARVASAPEPVSPGPVSSGQVSSRPAAAEGTAAESAPESAPASAPQVTRPIEPKPMTTAFEAPVGHWSRQGEAVEDDAVHESETGIRRVTDTSTGALILPNSALGDVTGALNATGEVILTGSIDLPKSLSSTGSHRPIDGAEVDRLLDQHDEQPDTDASPVRASRAVSSHTSTRQVVLAAAKPKQSRGPLILGWSAGGVGAVAIAAIVYVLVVGIH